MTTPKVELLDWATGFIPVAASPPLQDNRCPICLGDLYTCDCGKPLKRTVLTTTDEGDE
jgi:hypothetical protein